MLVNNAGMSPLYPDLVSVTEELFDKVVGVNLKGPFRLAALVGARMAAGDGGSIINVSSVAAIRPTPERAALRRRQGRARHPHHRLRPGLRARRCGSTRSSAGPFFTDISEAWDKEHVAEMFATYPLGRGGDPHEIVGTALYLASDASSFTTGDGAAGRRRPGHRPLTRRRATFGFHTDPLLADVRRRRRRSST